MMNIRIEKSDNIYVAVYEEDFIVSYGRTEIEALQNLVYCLEDEEDCVELD